MADRWGKVETVIDFIFLGSKITGNDDCSYEIKRCLLLGSKAMWNLDSILKSRDITLLTKVCIVKAMVLYGCESWVIKKAKPQRIDAFELWCWRRLFRVPLTASSNQSILKEVSAQSCPILCDPMDCSPPGSSVHGIGHGKNTGVGYHFLLQGTFLTQGSNLCLLHYRWILNCPTFTSIYGYWKNHSLDYMDICQQSDVSAF